MTEKVMEMQKFKIKELPSRLSDCFTSDFDSFVEQEVHR
jgi:hypothetical protein